MRLLVSSLVLLVGGGWIAAPAAATELPWDIPFNSDTTAIARAAAGVPAEPGEPAVVLLSEISYRYDEQGRETRTERLVYRIAAAGAHESWSVVSEEWSPWHQQKPEIRARVISPDGTAHPLDPAVLTENGAGSNEPDLFEDQRVLRGPLPATAPGVVVEEEIIVRESAPYFEGGVVRFVDLAHSVTCRRARLVIEAPAALPLSWVTRLLPQATPRDERAAGRRRLTFNYRDLPRVREPEVGLPPDVPRLPYVGFSTAASWGDIARRYSAIVDTAIRGSDVSALSAAAAGATSQEDAVARVLARLAEIRYTGVELGQGGIIPRTPDETQKRRFGDCKDKAVLLVAALRALDIPAYVALLAAGEGEADVEEALPGFGAFDHAIAVVPGTPPIWIDPTDPYARAGELPVADQGRLALIASPTTPGLTRTPEASAAENRDIETREFRLAELGPASVRETSEYHGASERDLRAYYAAADRDQVKKELTDYARDAYLAQELASFDFSPPGRLAEPFRLEIELKEARRGMTDLAEAAVAILPADLLSNLPAELVEGATAVSAEPGPARVNDYYFARPATFELRYRVVAPAGFVPRALPLTKSRALGTATLSEQYVAAPDGSVTATLRLDTGRRRIGPEQFTALKKAVAELANAKPVLLVFEHVGEAHLAAGRVREALVELRGQAAAAPGKALPHVRLARALLAGGLGEAARQEALAATAAEPGSAVAHRTLGWVLQHDALGRRFGEGFDHARALAAYRKARELDPADAAARADLAILLEHDAAGRRYSAGSDLAAAIAEYRGLRTDLAETGMDDHLLIALMRAGRFAEMKALADEIERTEPRAHLRLVATAATAGPEEALREAERSFSEADKRLTALAAAAQNLIIMRRYPEAAVLLNRAGQLSPRAAALLTTAEILRRTRRHEEVVLDPASPATPVRQLLLLPVARDPEKLRQLFVTRQARALSQAQLLELRDTAGAVAGRSDGEAMPLEAAVDLGLAALRETVSGSDAVGYRVEMRAAVGESHHRTAVFVVREGSGYRIAGLGNLPESLGDQALHYLTAGDLAAARQWLDWARDELGGQDDDPVQGSPFAALWRKGRQAGLEETRCAAAALAALGRDAAELPLLTACRKEAEAAGDLPRQIAVEAALVRLYGALGRYPEMLDTARRLAAARPDDPAPFGWVSEALGRLGRWEELRAAARERLAARPDDAAAQRALVEVASATGDPGKAEELLTRLADAGQAGAEVFNRLAWGALLRGEASEQALEWGQRSATLSSYRDASALHTLAALYAEQGKTAEAYQVMLQALEARRKAAPSPDDWYVFGRLAEQYGLPEVARQLYRRALPSPATPAKDAAGADGPSSRPLAEARLAALGPAPPGQSGSLRNARP